MEKDESFWLNVCYVSFAIICGFIYWQAIETIGIQTDWGVRYSWYPMLNYGSSTGLGAVSALWLRASPERHEYFLASVAEVRRVSWPTIPDTRRMTIIVCVVVAIFAAIMLVFDTSWSALLKLIMGIAE
jgi:preprotein translocase SecE subunit